MNKAAVRNFAVWARNRLMEEVRFKAMIVGVTERGIAAPMTHSTEDLKYFDVGKGNKPHLIKSTAIKQREKLVDALNKEAKLQGDYKKAFDVLVEETAYTWFNRLVALRFMEVNQYLPSGMRVLSGSGNKMEPELVAKPFNSNFAFSEAEKAQIIEWKEGNKANEIFAFLFIRQCNELNAFLPELFEKIDDYTELLINMNYTDPDGVVRHLITDIPENDFKETVEIIGWLYQYYNAEPKAAVDAYVKAGKKVVKKDIPAKTQLFTPDWIVRYMVENSLGRLWIEGHPNEELKKNWKYYLEEAEQEEDVKRQLEEISREHKAIKPEHIKVIDPCMGSGHILVYMFTVLMQIYESTGYNPRDAAVLILEKNLYGLDIDDRAYQLAYFAVMMKARQYNRTLFTKTVKPHLYAIHESNGIDINHLQYFGEGMGEDERNAAYTDIKTLVMLFNDGKEYGSLLKIPALDFGLMREYFGRVDPNSFLPLSEGLFSETERQPALMDLEKDFINDLQARLCRLIDVAEILNDKYHAVVTNPPYMNLSYMNSQLSIFIKKEYENSKSDLFAAFIERSVYLTKRNTYTAIITQQAWMFLSSFETLRKMLLANNIIINMAHLGYGSFGFADFGLTSFVLCSNNIKNHKGCFVRLTDNNSPEWKEREFFNNNYRFKPASADLSKIPGSPIAYWISEKTLSVFNNDTIGKSFFSGGRNKTHNDDEYLMFHWEIARSSKWVAYAKGGAFRRWYGNIVHVVNWSEEARNHYQSQGGLLNKRFWNKEGVTWTIVTASKSSYRVKPKDVIFSSVSPTIFNEQFIIDYNVLGFLNSVVAQHFIEILDPTLATNMKDVLALPYIEGIIDRVNILVNENISLSRADWDSFETSWDFKRHPLIPRSDLCVSAPLREISSSKISDYYDKWQKECEVRFNTLKANEEELNRIFIEIYGLQDELSPEVEDKDITVRRADKGREMRSLISYAVGCIFGRYSLDVEGLAFAGGEWDNNKYKTFIPDKGNCLPITDEVFFNVDIVSRFIDLIQTVYGEKNLEENLTFIALALNSAGRNSREILRNYFLNDFYKDHVKVYRKRPIYWLFDSGKDNGFKALIYLHRYDAFTTSNLRIDHLHQLQYAYESEIKYLKQKKEEQQENFPPKSDKQLEKLQKQLRETKVYDAQIAHLADSRIEIDLDDGVKRNYEKVQTARGGKRYEVLGKI
jgi:type II restriction/modification system DNA methylase subunit YeeA